MKKQMLATLLASGLSLGVAYGSGYSFIGAELGGAGAYSTFSLGIIGGYNYFFPSNMQFDSMRHGVRGYGSLNWGNASLSSVAFLRVGSDWTIEFNPQSRNIWGAFAGLSLGGVFGGANTFGWSTNIGASLSLKRVHRLELAVGYGYGIATFRYLYKF